MQGVCASVGMQISMSPQKVMLGLTFYSCIFCLNFFCFLTINKGVYHTPVIAVIDWGYSQRLSFRCYSNDCDTLN